MSGLDGKCCLGVTSFRPSQTAELLSRFARIVKNAPFKSFTTHGPYVCPAEEIGGSEARGSADAMEEDGTQGIGGVSVASTSEGRDPSIDTSRNTSNKMGRDKRKNLSGEFDQEAEQEAEQEAVQRRRQ